MFVYEKVLVVGPSRFEIPLEAGRLRVKIENLEGPPIRTFTYVKRRLIFFYCHPITFMHLIFSTESEYYDAIIFSTLTFMLLAFAKRPLSFGDFAKNRTL
jgi:hypothetical protein